MQKYGHGLKKLREVVYLAAKLAPDSNNWGENDYMRSEIEEKIVSCFWPYIYDLIESFYSLLFGIKLRIGDLRSNIHFCKPCGYFIFGEMKRNVYFCS
jgi:hypothetical protein